MGRNTDPGRRSGLLPLAGPGLRFCRPYRAQEGSGGILPLDLSKDVQSPANRFVVASISKIKRRHWIQEGFHSADPRLVN
jgi:hypothetical protein